MNTAIYLLRVIQIGLRLKDLDVLDYGTVIDMMTESGNDREKYEKRAKQEDFDRF